MTHAQKIVVSVIAIALVVVHQFVPEVKIDATTLILITVAILPWILEHIKGFEIPGVVKIDLIDAKAATDKVIRARIQPGTGEMGITGQVAVTKEGPPPDSLAILWSVYKSDPNLALVGFRIEVEKRIRELARVKGIGDDRATLHDLIRDLINRAIIPADAGSGLIDMVALGNRAAHGASVSVPAAAWVLDVGPSILFQLENLTRDSKRTDQ